MCAIEDCEPADVWTHRGRKARIAHGCEECGRRIAPGETYHEWTWLYEGRWSRSKVCRHCKAAGVWLDVVCGGWPIGGQMLGTELRDHWDEGYCAMAFGRLIVAQRRGWHDGADPVPEGVDELARQMMAARVAA